MKYLIYKITNNINGKIYIGKHKTENLDDRYFGSGKYLRNAIEKYGMENFTFHLEFELQNEEELNLLEKLVVNEQFVKRKDTYNLKIGGEGGQLGGERHPMFGKHFHHSDEARKKMSEACKGRPSPNKGKHLSEENKRKQSAVHKGRHFSEETRRKMSKAHKGMPSPNKGNHYTLSENTRKKICEAAKRREAEKRRNKCLNF